MSISKRFATFGRQYLMFRAETFNVLNHPNIGAAGTQHPEHERSARSRAPIGDPRIVQLVVKYYF